MPDQAANARAFDGDGNPIDPGACVVPIMKRIGRDRLAIIGTGFYISRLGLFMTAAHVLAEIVDESKNQIRTGYICHKASDQAVHLRRILAVNTYLKADIAIGQADNFSSRYPDSPLQNMRTKLTGRVPKQGSLVTTYAYPENKVLDFEDPEAVPEIRSDYYDGDFLREVVESDHPEIPYRHYETSILIKSGASGGPVFCQGSVIGLNCRGWDFGSEDDALSYIVPVEFALGVIVGGMQLPERSWEYSQIPEAKRGTTLTLGQLVEFGHVLYTT